MDSNNKQTNQSFISSASKAVTPYTQKADYDKSVRSKIDDVSKRKNFKEKTFDGKRTMQDPYTGDTLHIDSNAAKAKYGKSKATKHTADVDHIIPVETVYERAKNNAFLDISDIKEIANQEGNYKVINSKTNRAKQSRSNRKYIKEHWNELSTHQKHEMVHDQIKADVAVNTAIAQETVQNAHAVGIDAAKSGISVGAGISTTQNMAKVLTGDYSIGEATFNIAIDTAKAGAVSYISGIETRIIEATARNISKSAGSYVSSCANHFLQTGGPAKTLAILSEVGETVTNFLAGEIDEKEFINELGEKGTSLAMSFVAGTQGATVGGFLGAIVGSVIPGAGTVAGATIGTAVGELVGNMVGYMIGSKICHTLKTGIDSYEAYLEQQQQLTIYYNQMANQLEKHRIELEKSLQTALNEHRTTLNHAFTSMNESILANDTNAITDSLRIICEEFGTTLPFATQDKFDAFMTDNSSVIKLGV